MTTADYTQAPEDQHIQQLKPSLNLKTAVTSPYDDVLNGSPNLEFTTNQHFNEIADDWIPYEDLTAEMGKSPKRLTALDGDLDAGT